MRKKVEVTIANRRRLSDFFGRVREVYERKFDGFPAKPADASGRNVDGTTDPDAINVDDIVDQINQTIQKQTDPAGSTIPPCPDNTDCFDNRTMTTPCYGTTWLVDSSEPNSSSRLSALGIPTTESGGNAFIYSNINIPVSATSYGFVLHARMTRGGVVSNDPDLVVGLSYGATEPSSASFLTETHVSIRTSAGASGGDIPVGTTYLQIVGINQGVFGNDKSTSAVPNSIGTQGADSASYEFYIKGTTSGGWKYWLASDAEPSTFKYSSFGVSGHGFPANIYLQMMSSGGNIQILGLTTECDTTTNNCPEPSATFIGSFGAKNRWKFNGSTWSQTTGGQALLADYMDGTERDFQTWWVTDRDPDVGYIAPHQILSINYVWEIGIENPGISWVNGKSISWELVQGNWGNSQPTTSNPGGTIVASGTITAPAGPPNVFSYYVPFENDIPITPVGTDNLVQLYLRITGSSGTASTDRLGIFRDLFVNSPGGENADISGFIGILGDTTYFDCEPCSGNTILADAIRISPTTYATRVLAKYIISVIVDGVEMVPSVDWTFSNNQIVFYSSVDASATVTVKFVAA